MTPRIGKLLTKHVWIKAVVRIHVACRIAWSEASCWRRTRKTGMPIGSLEFSDGFQKNGVKIVKVQLQLRQIRGITWCFFFFLSYFFGSFFGFKVCRGVKRGPQKAGKRVEDGFCRDHWLRKNKHTDPIAAQIM